MEHVDSALRYLPAEHVDTPVGALAGTILVSPTDETVGTLDGVVIDPALRKVRYFVVRSGNWLKTHRHLVPVTPARLDAAHRTLHVDLEPNDLPQCPEVRSDTFERYSDEDVIAALFSHRAA